MAMSLQRLYFKREFEVAINVCLLGCACIFSAGHLQKQPNKRCAPEKITAFRGDTINN